ncbi:MAG TPA: ROK family protein [Xanthobacteraceae bacterium]|nr:ROK family protein [Xanthobacteraceae bacterium]
MPRPTPTVLIADIGGTTCRFAVIGPDGRPDRIVRFANKEVPDLAAAVGRYVVEAEVQPRAGVLAVAAPVDGDEITLTNCAWQFRVEALKRQLGFAQLCAINDFAAVAWALLGLAPDQVRAIGPASACQDGVRLACGPGTGLGVAALIPENGAWRVHASEGGHVSFGPCDADEEPVFARLRAMTGPVSAEMVLSGPGLMRLHRALHPEAGPVASEAIIAGATAGDAAAAASVKMFVRLLGRFAGDVALVFKAARVYLAGGVGEGIAPLIDAQEFRRAFEAHRPYERLLATIPTFVITERTPGLTGCAVYARQMMAAQLDSAAQH